MRRARASPFAGAAVAGPLTPAAVPAYGGDGGGGLASAQYGGPRTLAGLDSSGWRLASDPSLRGGGGYFVATGRGPASYDGGDAASSPSGLGLASHFMSNCAAGAAGPARFSTAAAPQLDPAAAEATVALMEELWCVSFVLILCGRRPVCVARACKREWGGRSPFLLGNTRSPRACVRATCRPP
jgi:hypothetical protein